MRISFADISGPHRPSLYPAFREFPDDQWKTPLILTVAFHIFVLSLAVFGPSIFNHRRYLPEVYTVSLFNAAEISPAPPAPAPAAPPQEQSPPVQKAPAPETAPLKPVVPIPKEAVSLKPLKQKDKKPALDKKKIDEDSLARALTKIRTKAVGKQAEDRARREINAALDQLRDSLRSSPVTTESSASDTGVAAGGGGASTVPEAIRQYYAALILHLQQYWKLPPLQKWDDSLEARVVIWIRRDGFVKKSTMEEKSDNMYFNKFVEQAISEAAPMPAFPDNLTEDELEIGLRFRPGELF